MFTLSGAAHASGTIEQAPTRTVTDALGRTVEIPADPQRIVMPARAVMMIANALYMFPGASERVVGIGRIDQGKGNFLTAIDPHYDRKALFERAVGPEQIVSVSPDLAIMKSDARNELGDGLERLGIPVVYVDFETPEQYQRDLRLLGDVLGQPDRAEAIALFYERETAAVVRAVETRGSQPRTLFLSADLAGAEQVFNVPPDRWIQTTLVRLAGGEPVWVGANPGGGWARVGLEQIAAWDPDVITLVAYRQDVDAVRASLLANPTWNALSAVQTDSLHPFPIDYYSWDQPDVRWILGLKWLAQTLHGDRFTDVDLAEEIYDFYAFSYGMSREQIDEVIFATLEGVER